MERKIKNFKRWLLFGGIFNICATSPLILPVTAKIYCEFYIYLQNLLHLGGKEMAISDNPLFFMFTTLTGVGDCLIGSLVLYASRKPLERSGIALLNGLARILFGIVQIFYLGLILNIARIMLSFAVIDIVIGGIFIYYYLSLRKMQLDKK